MSTVNTESSAAYGEVDKSKKKQRKKTAGIIKKTLCLFGFIAIINLSKTFYSYKMLFFIAIFCQALLISTDVPS